MLSRTGGKHEQSNEDSSDNLARGAHSEHLLAGLRCIQPWLGIRQGQERGQLQGGGPMIPRKRVTKAARRKRITMGALKHPKRNTHGNHNTRNIGGLLFQREVEDGEV
jgi:hypothetical protein